MVPIPAASPRVLIEMYILGPSTPDMLHQSSGVGPSNLPVNKPLHPRYSDACSTSANQLAFSGSQTSGKSDETVETPPRIMHRHIHGYLQRFAHNFKGLIP